MCTIVHYNSTSKKAAQTHKINYIIKPEREQKIKTAVKTNNIRSISTSDLGNSSIGIPLQAAGVG